VFPDSADHSLSPEAAVLFAPWRAWPRIAESPSRYWLARPLFALFIYSCAASLATSARVTPRLVIPAMLHAVYVPLLQMAALAIVCRGALPFRRAVDVFFAGHAAVSSMFLAFGATWAFAAPGTVYARFGNWHIIAPVVFAWSAYVDYWFFRSIAKQGPLGGAGAVMAHRLLWGIPAVAFFVGPAAWQEFLHKVGR
jgi:hypothetical protein